MAAEEDADVSDDLTPDDVEETDPAELQQIADAAIDQFNETLPQEHRELVIANFLHTGEIDALVVGVDQDTLDATVAAFESKMTTEALQPFGLDLDTYLDHCDEADLPAIRQLVVRGDWSSLADHAGRIRTALNALPD